MPNPILFLRIKTQFGNLGDALINRELIRLLAQNGEVVINLSAAPPLFKAWIDKGIPASVVRAGGPGYWLRLGRALISRPITGRACWVVLNPGGYAGEIGTIPMIGKLLGALRLRCLRGLGCKAMLVGVSYERLGPRLLRALRAQARALDFHAPRDRQTAAYCLANRLRFDTILPDLAFALPIPTERKEPRTRAIASFRQQPGLDAVAALSGLLPKGYSLDFAWQVASDAPYQTQLCEEWADLGHRPTLYPLNESIEQAQETYQTCDVVYSNRLHVLLLAMSVGAYAVPVLAPGQSRKIRGIFSDLGLESRIVDAGGPILETDPDRAESRDIEAFATAQRALALGIAELLGAE